MTTSIPRVTRFRYVAFATPDFDKAAEFYGGTWGLKRVEGETDVAYFAAEGSPEQYVVRLRRAEEKRIDVVGFEAPDPGAVDALATALASDGVRFASEPGTLSTPGGGYGFRFFDLDGRTIEVSSDVATRAFRTLEEHETIPSKLSHIVLGSPDVKATTAWYQEKLGFRLSDWIAEFFSFLRCSPDYHSLAFVQSKHASLNHVSFETRGLEETMRAMGRAVNAGVPLQMGPTFYDNAQMAGAYFYDPAGFVTEYASPQRQVMDDTAWQPRVWAPSETEVWGLSRRPDPDAVPANAQSVPDPGLFVAPPV